MLVRESLYNFKRSGDAIESSGLSQRKLMEEWLEEYRIGGYTINDDLTIDCRYDVRLRNRGLEGFPEFIKFNKVLGTFQITDNKFKNLIGCPNYVRDSFQCSTNPLNSLEGLPKFIGGNFFIRETPISIPNYINDFVEHNDIIIEGKMIITPKDDVWT